MSLSEQLRPYGIASLWNVSHLDNLPSLLERGLLCWNDANQLASRVDIADRHVQNRRRPRFDARLNKIFEPHAHVPLFFADNTPMLFVTASADRRVILLEIHSEAADAPNVCFSDGNVAAADHCLYSDPADLAHLDWQIINSRRPAWGTDHDGIDWKCKRSAEVLIPGCCPATFIRTVHVQRFAKFDGIPVLEMARSFVASSQRPDIGVSEDLLPQGVW